MSNDTASYPAAPSPFHVAGREDSDSRPTLSIVVPLYNEEAVLLEFHQRTSKMLDEIGERAEILYVNDGSTDRSPSILSNLQDTDSRVSVVNLSRNFGKEIALTAGLDHSHGRAVVLIDADLQHPPRTHSQIN